MMRQSLKLLVVLCLATVVLVGCNRYDEKIIGSWNLDYWMLYSPDGQNGDIVKDCVFTFKKDGRGVLMAPYTTIDTNNQEIISTNFEYSVDDEELRTSLPDFESNHIEKLDDTKMVLSQTSVAATGSQMIVFSFTKK
jgi:hypothetical protein